MAQVQANGITIEYESFGSTDNPTILLVMGLGGQLTLWNTELCEELVTRGYHVVRYDNRDVGLSTKFDAAGIPDMEKIFTALATGGAVDAPYSLDDMAADGMALLDALGIDKAHIAGASMGGMIVQLMATNHPEKVLSLTSIMSNTGNPEVPQGSDAAMGALMAPAPDPSDHEAVIARGMNTWTVIGSPGYRTPEPQLREWVERDTARSYYPQGTIRQMAAIVSNGDRREKLKKLNVPAVVLHGKDDPLVPVAGGEDTAASIPGAELRVIPGMGHDFPVSLVDVFADAITAAASRASASQAAE
ncbi:alpha/beta fold hydrolase [Parvibaculum sp. MBR-TMA-1.3b-4.2]|jgi:pimeloyl-ACP methyl ester carboxylesterase